MSGNEIGQEFPPLKSILYGASYYQEYMPYEQLDDVALMKRAGVSVVRVGESTWSLWEPQEGRFEHAWMDRVIDAIHTRGHQGHYEDTDLLDSDVDAPAPPGDPDPPRQPAADHIWHAAKYEHRQPSLPILCGAYHPSAGEPLSRPSCRLRLADRQ
jgi:hypothetical protein